MFYQERLEQSPRRREGLAIGQRRLLPYTNPFDVVDGPSKSLDS